MAPPFLSGGSPDTFANSPQKEVGEEEEEAININNQALLVRNENSLRLTQAKLTLISWLLLPEIDQAVTESVAHACETVASYRAGRQANLSNDIEIAVKTSSCVPSSLGSFQNREQHKSEDHADQLRQFQQQKYDNQFLQHQLEQHPHLDQQQQQNQQHQHQQYQKIDAQAHFRHLQQHQLQQHQQHQAHQQQKQHQNQQRQITPFLSRTELSPLQTDSFAAGSKSDASFSAALLLNDMASHLPGALNPLPLTSLCPPAITDPSSASTTRQMWTSPKGFSHEERDNSLSATAHSPETKTILGSGIQYTLPTGETRSFPKTTASQNADNFTPQHQNNHEHVHVHVSGGSLSYKPHNFSIKESPLQQMSDRLSQPYMQSETKPNVQHTINILGQQIPLSAFLSANETLNPFLHPHLRQQQYTQLQQQSPVFDPIIANTSQDQEAAPRVKCPVCKGRGRDSDSKYVFRFWMYNEFHEME